MGVLHMVAAAAPQEPDPELVTPGAVGLVMLLALGLAVVFLLRSMNRQLKRIDLPEERSSASREHAPDDEQPGA